ATGGEIDVTTGGQTLTIDTTGIVNAGTLTIGGAGNTTVSSAISGAGALTKADGGTLTLSGTNTYAGTTTINAGTLTVSGGSAIADGGAVSLANVAGASFELSTSETIGSLAGGGALGGNVNLNATTLTTGDATNTTYSGVISGAGGILTKEGAGTLTLDGTNSYTGATNINTGTLTVAADQALGTAAGATTVANGATLGISGTTNYATAEALTLNGTGAAGRSGALDNIINDNTFAGNITLATASKIGSTAGTLTASGTIDNGGNLLTVGGASDATLSGVISNTGGLTKADAGTVTLSGINTYSGITTINAGTLSIGADSGLGTAPGAATAGQIVFGGGILESSGSFTLAANRGIAMTGAGTIDVDAGTTLTYNGIVAGASALTKADTGTLSLGGTNTYTGGTTFNAGTIILGDDAALGTGTLTLGGAGTIQSNDDARAVSNAIALGGNALTVSGASNLTLSGVISGAGAGSTLTKTGTGTLTLTGVNTHVGLTTLTAGTLTGAFSLNGAGGLTLGGGTFRPGNSIGTVVIVGPYTQNAGSTLEVEVSNSGGVLTSDLLDVTGTVNLAAGSTIDVVDVSPAGSIIVTGDTFNIIQAGGAITDGGPTITDNSAVLSFTGGVSGAFYQLTAARRTFASAIGGGGGGPLGAIDSDMANATGDYITLINALTELNTAQLRDAEEQLDPLPHASSTIVSIRNTQQMTGNLANYLSARRSGTERAMMFDSQTYERQTLIADASNDPRMLAYVINENKKIEEMQQEAATDNGIKGFFRPFGVFYDHDTTSGMTGFDAKAVGALFGVDRNYGSNWIAGVGGGYTRSSLHFKGNRGEGESDSFRVGPYASYSKKNFFVDTSVSLGFHENKNKRNIRFGTINRTARGDYRAYDLSVYAGTGYDFHLKALTVTPTASMQYITYHSEGFRETGAGAAGLKVNSTTSESLRSKLGVTLSKVLELHGTKVIPEVFAGWAHEFMDDENIQARFVDGTAKFTTGVDDEWDDSVYFGAGLSALLKKNVSAFVRYEGEYSSGNGINALNFGITVLF
ncbi:MAG: autotransporter domain-containing protein, partial [Phycisphaerae bacterium]|nr:autotransporter domain-containing protein [Phycisphaerae bacterium]